MKIKYILILILAVISYLSLAINNSNASTEGNYFGVNAIYSNASHKYNPFDTKYKEFKNSNVGGGIEYRYAINLDGFFIAPSLVMEAPNTNAQDKDGDDIKIKYRYGSKINIGYDIFDNFAIYLTSGAMITSAESNWSAENGKTVSDTEESTNKISSDSIDNMYGAGFTFGFTDNLAFNFEYNSQRAKFRSPWRVGFTKEDTVSTAIDTRIDSFKCGFIYKFDI
jgi:opacity protein-like surface antigen